MATLYDVLGISKSASPDEVRAAYRAKVKRVHPDAGGDPEAFRAVAAAYETLKDPVARLRYDMTLEGAPPPSGPEHGVLAVPLVVAVAGGSVPFRGMVINIPPGTLAGDRLLVRLRGSELHLTVVVQPHPNYEIRGLDLDLGLPITWFEFYTGARIDLATPWRRITLDVAPGCPEGLLIVVPGDGLRTDAGRGNLYIHLQLVAPELGDDALAGVLLRLQRLQNVRGTLGERFG